MMMMIMVTITGEMRMQIFSVVYSSERKCVHKKVRMDRKKKVKSSNIK
jgi:hypothetical protein